MTKAAPDLNGTFRTEGPEGVRRRHDKARRYTGKANGADTKQPRFKLTRLCEIIMSTTAAYLVKGIIARHGIVIVWGRRLSHPLRLCS